MRLFNRAVIGMALAAWTLAPLPLLAQTAAASAADGLVQIASGGPQPPRHNAQDDVSQSAESKNAAQEKDGEPSLDEKFRRRFPQPVKVGDLIGLPVLDFDDSTIGYVKSVVRRPDGEIDLIVPYSAWLGWLHTERGKRPVAVPIKSVAILGRQLDALEFTRHDFDEAPTWQPSDGSPIGLHEKTLIALGRR